MAALDHMKSKIEAETKELGLVDVAEPFRPSRFTEGARHLGLNAGFAVDLETGRLGLRRPAAGFQVEGAGESSRSISSHWQSEV